MTATALAQGFGSPVPEERARQDQTIKGYKTRLKENPRKARADVERIIKNTYRTLMTRGMKGCYVHCTDPETNRYFRAAAARPARDRMAAET